MFIVNADFKRMASAHGVFFRARVEIQNLSNSGAITSRATYYSDDLLIDFSLSQGSPNAPLIGQTHCAGLEATFARSAKINLGAGLCRLSLSVGFRMPDGGNTMWHYLCKDMLTAETSLSEDGNTVSVRAFDKMYKLNRTLPLENIRFPVSAASFLDYICARAGLTLRPQFVFPHETMIEAIPTRESTLFASETERAARELLDELAAICGGNFKIDNNGYLALTSYSRVSETIQRKNIFPGGTRYLGSSDTIRKVIWKNALEDEISGDEDMSGVIVFETSMKYSEDADFLSYIESKLIGLTYETAVIAKQGFGYYEVGDIMRAQTEKTGEAKTILITGINYKGAGAAFTEVLNSTEQKNTAVTSSRGSGVSGGGGSMNIVTIPGQSIVLERPPTDEEVQNLANNTLIFTYDPNNRQRQFGLSAYELAVVKDGFTGTYDEWREANRGDTGPPGPPGQSITGPPGIPGLNGKDGLDAAQVAIQLGWLGTVSEYNEILKSLGDLPSIFDAINVEVLT